MLDLDGGGITTTAVNRFGTYFDLDANGFAEATAGLVLGRAYFAAT